MIVAVDFDGVLCEDAFPEIGRPNWEVVFLVRQLIGMGHEVILWTCRVEERLAEAVEWCEAMGLHFCAVNDNAPSNLEQYGTNSRKVYADLYLEDRDPWFMQDPDPVDALVLNAQRCIRDISRDERSKA